ncbi:MAG: NDP-sugar synthase [Rhodocyclaceae bacterium]|nr:NDP-sugar synthase [Rhodocyclaceae bacterium]
MAKGMILAAGQGTRVRPLTSQLPKPMVPILGKPVMEYLVEHLARYGIREIMVNVAFNHWKIENYFGDGRRWGVSLGYSYEGAREHGELVPKAIGSAGALRKIQDFGGFFDDTTIVMCGDAIVDLDIGAALHEHRKKAALASVVTLDVPREDVKNYGIVVTDESGRVESFQEKPAPEEARSTLASTGIYILEPGVIDMVPSDRPFDIGSDLFPKLVEEKHPFFAQNRFFNWIDIGRLADYWEVSQRVLRGEVAQMDMPGKEVKPGVWVGLNTSIAWDSVQITGPVYIGSGVRIDPGVSIVGPSWIGHGSLVRTGAKIERCILQEYTRIGESQRMTEMIVSPRFCVQRDGTAHYLGEDDCPFRWGDARG